MRLFFLIAAALITATMAPFASAQSCGHRLSVTKADVLAENDPIRAEHPQAMLLDYGDFDGDGREDFVQLEKAGGAAFLVVHLASGSRASCTVLKELPIENLPKIGVVARKAGSYSPLCGGQPGECDSSPIETSNASIGLFEFGGLEELFYYQENGFQQILVKGEF